MMSIISRIKGALIVSVAFVGAVILAWLNGRSAGASSEKTKRRAKDADAYEKHLKEIADAADARNRVQSADSVSDQHRRD